MAVNRYVGLRPTQYESQRIPLPFEELAAIGQSQQKKADDALEQTYKLQDMMNNVHAIDQHLPYKQQLHDKYYSKIENIADRIVNKGDLTAQRDINKIAREWINDPLRNELETSYANYEGYKKDKIAKGDKYGQWWDPTTNFKGTLDGNIEPFRYTGMGERQDHQKRAEDMMNNIKASGDDNKYFDLDKEGNILKIKKGYEGIGVKRVQQLAMNKVGDFLSTKEGEDFAREFMFRHPEGNQKDLLGATQQYLFNAGSNQIFGKSTSEQDFDYAPEYINKQKTQGQELVFGENTPIVDLTQKVFDPTKLTKQTRYEEFIPKQGDEGYQTYLRTEGAVKPKRAVGQSYGKLDDKEQKMFDNIAKNYFPGVTNKDELNSKVKQFLDNMSSQQISTYAESIPDNIKYPYSGDKKGAEGLTYSVFGGAKVQDVGSTGHYLNRNFYNPETGEVLSGTQFYDKVLSEQEKDAPINVVSQYSNKNPFTVLTQDDKFARSYQVVVGNKQYIMSGADKEIIRTPQGDIDQSGHDKFINKISRVQYSPDKSGEIQVPVKTSKGEVKYSKAEVMQMPDGKWKMLIPEINTSVEGTSEEDLAQSFSNLFK